MPGSISAKRFHPQRKERKNERANHSTSPLRLRLPGVRDPARRSQARNLSSPLNASDCRRARWNDSLTVAMSELANLFPTMRGVPGTNPWNVEALIAWMNTGAPTTGSWHAAMFLLGVWNPAHKVESGRLEDAQGRKQEIRSLCRDAWVGSAAHRGRDGMDQQSILPMIRRRPIPRTRVKPEFSQHYETILDGAVLRYRDGREVCTELESRLARIQAARRGDGAAPGRPLLPL